MFNKDYSYIGDMLGFLERLVEIIGKLFAILTGGSVTKKEDPTPTPTPTPGKDEPEDIKEP